MNARSPGQLGQAAKLTLHLIGRGHHQIGELIDDDHPVGKRMRGARALVIAFDIAHAELREAAVPAVHFVDDGLQGTDDFFGISNHLGEGQVGYVGERGQLDALGVYEDQAQVFRGVMQEQ